jgi:4-hydroxy-tetrahydrodipicolinate synthase
MAGWTWDQALSGVIPPMISPLNAQGSVDVQAVGRVAAHILDGGCSGLFVLGGVGQGPWLSTAQRAGVVRASVDAAAGSAPVLVGCMLPGTAPVRDAAFAAADAGADALVVGSPYYFGVDAASQQRHVEAILAATALPVLLYNIPQCTHTPLAREAVEALASEPRVLGIKDSWGELPYFQSLLTLKLRRPSFRVLQGHEHAAMASLLLGADGLVPGLGNIAPRLCVDLVNAAHAGEVETCRRLHADVMSLTEIYSVGLVGTYAACALLGLSENVTVEPWVPLSGDKLRTVEAVLQRHGLIRDAVAV